MKKIELFCEKVNELLEEIDFSKLEKSYNTREREYATEVLNELHSLFLDVYRSHYIGANAADDSEGFIKVPGIVYVPKTGKLVLALLDLDVRSSGEHYNTEFFTKYGLLPQFSEELNKEEKEYIQAMIPYTYFYTPYISGDIHTRRRVPKPVSRMLAKLEKDNSWAV